MLLLILLWIFMTSSKQTFMLSELGISVFYQLQLSNIIPRMNTEFQSLPFKSHKLQFTRLVVYKSFKRTRMQVDRNIISKKYYTIGHFNKYILILLDVRFISQFCSNGLHIEWPNIYWKIEVTVSPRRAYGYYFR